MTVRFSVSLFQDYDCHMMNITFFHFITELYIYHLPLFITSYDAYPSSSQGACHARHQSIVAQWLEHPTGIRRVIDSIPVAFLKSSEDFLERVLIFENLFYFLSLCRCCVLVQNLGAIFFIK